LIHAFCFISLHSRLSSHCHRCLYRTSTAHRPKAAQAWILAASVFFYATSKPFNLVLIFASILANWLFARWIERTEQPIKKRILVAALVANVVYLSTFKYLAFFASLFAFAFRAAIACSAAVSARHQLLYRHADHVPG